MTVAMALAVAACGDEGDDEDRATGTPTPPLATPSASAAHTGTPRSTDEPTETPTPTPSPTDPQTGTPTPRFSVEATRTSTASASATATPSPTPTTTPSPIALARFLGAYDASRVDTGRLIPEEWIGTVTGTDQEVEIDLWLDGHSIVGTSGPLRLDNSVVLDGGGRLEDDILIDAQGSATLAETGGVQRVIGEVHDPNPGFGFAMSFRFTRPAAGAPSRFNGTYRFTLTPSPSGCPITTTAALTIETGDDGVGRTTADATEVDEGGNQVGTFHDGECLLTASGRLRCEMFYEATCDPPPGTLRVGPKFYVTLTGAIDATGGSGVSSAVIFPSPYFLGGTWTATR